MKKLLPIILVALTAGALCAKEAIMIGVITPMSGEMGDLCKEMITVMQKRTEEINADPKTKYEYKLLFEDSQWLPRPSYLAANKLLFQDKVDALMPIASLAAKITMPLVERARVPQLSLAYEECADGKRCFTYFLKSGDITDLSANTLKALGFKSFAYLGQQQEALLKSAADMKKRGAALGIEDHGHFWFNAGEVHDYRMQLLKARETGAKIFYFQAPPPDIDILLRQARQLGGFKNITSIETLEHVQQKEFLEGVWLAGCPPFTGAFREKLAAYGITSPKIQFTLYAYDLPTIMTGAFETAGDGKTKPTGEEVCAVLSNMKTVETLMGTIRQDEKGVFAPKPVLVYYEKGVARETSIEELKRLKGIK